MSFGIEGLHMCTTEHYLLHSKQSMMELAKDVQKGRIQRRHHVHAAEDDKPSRKRSRYEIEDYSSKD